MEAQLFDLDAMRAKQRIRTLTERVSCVQTAWGGSALIENALSFWAQYATAMMSFHARLWGAACSPWSTRPASAGKPWS